MEALFSFEVESQNTKTTNSINFKKYDKTNIAIIIQLRQA